MKKKLTKVIIMSFRALIYGTAIQIFFISILLANGSEAQSIQSVRDRIVSINLRNATLQQCFAEIEKKTDYKFSFDHNLIDPNVRITYRSDKCLVSDLLLEISRQANLKFKQINNNINVQKLDDPEKEKKVEVIIQSITITGRVFSEENNEGLPGVNVILKGTSEGTITDVDGKYSIIVPDVNAVLVFSSVGYIKQEVVVGTRTVIDIALKPDVKSLQEVVVTALGINREKDALGYSVSKIDGLENTGVYNMGNALSGKIPGVQVSQVASGTGGSSKIIIRGNNSLVGNSQPLYVVDGIPINNSNFGQAGRWGGTDYGDGLTSLSQDDIESITVLKGPNAASLYGERGANGVILITTKSGKGRKGIGVSYNGTFSVGDAAVLPDFQDEYGQGFNGNFTHLRANDGTIYSWDYAQEHGIEGMRKMSAGRNRLTRGSWGAPYDGLPHEDQFGNVFPYSPQPNTFQNYFEKEFKAKNTLTVTGGNDNVNYYLSYSNMYVDGYVPKNKITRNNFNLRTIGKIGKKVEIDAKINYVIEKNEMRPLLSDGVNNPVYLLISQPRSMYKEALQDYMWTAEQLKKALGYGRRAIPGNEKTYATNGSTANQYWTLARTWNEDRRDRIIGTLNVRYDVTSNLKVNLRGGVDAFTQQRYAWRAIGTRRTSRQKGDINETVNRVQEENYDALVTYDIDKIKNFRIQLSAGASHQKRRYRLVGYRGREFQIPGLHAINNTLTQYPSFSEQQSAINSVYGMAQFSYKEYLFLDLTGRNDWSSTLPLSDNSYFYPSASISFILSEALGLQKSALSYLKFRGSVAQAGSSGSPYQTFGNYSIGSTPYGGRPLGSFTSVIPDPNLKNEMTTSYEFGVDLKLFQNRIGLEATYYSASTINQIINVPLPTSTNFTSMKINSGEITNKGIELMLTAIPVMSGTGFTWEFTFNFSKNKNEVVSLAEGVDRLILGSDRNVNVVAEPGKPFAQLYGTSFSWQKDTNGHRLIDPATGLPIRSDGKNFHYLAEALPDWIGGFSNSLRYKGFNLFFLIDIREGGKIFSQSTREEILYGTIKKTLPGRDGTYVADGVIAQKNSDGEWVSTGVKNDIKVAAQDYWGAVASTKDNLVSEEMLNDASYISMREITLTYQFPKGVLRNTPIQSLNIGLFGRNLFYFQRNTDGFAPEASAFNVNNSGIGLESASLPILRTFGINLNIEF